MEAPPPGIYTLSLHDALPISTNSVYTSIVIGVVSVVACMVGIKVVDRDRKSTRLNSSHVAISYAVFCLKKKRLGKQCASLPRRTTRQSLAETPQHVRPQGGTT